MHFYLILKITTQIITYFCIKPNYRTVHLGFSKLLEKLVLKYLPDKAYKER